MNKMKPFCRVEKLFGYPTSPPNGVVCQFLIGIQPHPPLIGIARCDFAQRLIRAEVFDQASPGMPPRRRR
ncbi:MAG: hypothetical protein IT426_20725 [Pirellulales bacterium]|nr:hypothetical protein [Pirellulales bacterium]